MTEIATAFQIATDIDCPPGITHPLLIDNYEHIDRKLSQMYNAYALTAENMDEYQDTGMLIDNISILMKSFNGYSFNSTNMEELVDRYENIDRNMTQRYYAHRFSDNSAIRSLFESFNGYSFNLTRMEELESEFSFDSATTWIEELLNDYRPVSRASTDSPCSVSAQIFPEEYYF